MQVKKAVLPAVFLLWFLGCSKSTPPPQQSVDPLDRVDTTRVQPIHFLHKTFPLKKYVPFEFDVPPHSAIPRLHGTFKSFVRRPSEPDLSDSTADVDFILMNAEQFEEFVKSHGGGTALHTVDPTHDHEVEFLLSPTKADPEKYYVVFQNSAGGAPLKYVQADFTLSFGY